MKEIRFKVTEHQYRKLKEVSEADRRTIPELFKVLIDRIDDGKLKIEKSEVRRCF